jgi:protoporphyrin/coproporphyrin ferrochelatase
LVADGAGRSSWQLVYQIRSGSPQHPWLDPDIGDNLTALKQQGAQDVVVLPVGFISDHMEVLYDLDTEARAQADELGLNMVRAATVGTHPAFVTMIRQLVEERLEEREASAYLGIRPPELDMCRSDCCLPGMTRPVAKPEEIAVRG